MAGNMKTNKSKPNKTIPRVILAAAAVLILCGVLCGAAAAADLAAIPEDNSIVEKVTLHDVDTSQTYSLKFTASSLLRNDIDIELMPKSDLYIKPFKLDVTCNGAPMENAKLTVRFKVDKEKMEEYAASGDYQVRLGHMIEDADGKKKWELLEVTKVTSKPVDGYLHYEVKEIHEPSSFFVIVVTGQASQASSPVPAAGIIAGLGAGLAVMALRRR